MSIATPNGFQLDNSGTRVVVDPITRIEGHLRIEVRADAGRIEEAWACVTQFRGLELVMQGRDPRDAWAFAQRICGVCTTVHAIASIFWSAPASAIGLPQMRAPPSSASKKSTSAAISLRT